MAASCPSQGNHTLKHTLLYFFFITINVCIASVQKWDPNQKFVKLHFKYKQLNIGVFHAFIIDNFSMKQFIKACFPFMMAYQ